MPSDRIVLEDVLSPAEYGAIDSFCSDHPGIDSLKSLSKFLADRFQVDLACDPDIVDGFASDQSNLPGMAHAVARPANERDCAVVFRACSAAGIPFTVSGGRSNLTGSATPCGGVIVSMSKMLVPAPRVAASALKVTAPVGMILEDLRNEVLRQSGSKLILPVDPTSRGDACVGGAVACNASGFVPGEAGAIRNWVRSVDFLLPNGLKVAASRGQFVSEKGAFVLEHGGSRTVLPVPRYARPAIKNAGGPFSAPDGAMDFVDLVVGSEGILGLVTACELILQARPADYLDLFFSLPSEDGALKLLEYVAREVPGGPGCLTAFEYFGANCRRFMKHEDQLFHGGDPVGMYLQVPLADGAAEAAAEQWLGILMESGCGVREDAIILIDNDRNRKIFMEARHSLPANSLEVVKHRGTYTIMTDTVVPQAKFREFLDFTHRLIASESLDYLVFGHFGDCHLHFMILPEKEKLARATEVYDMIVKRSVELGGTYSGEHGTGKRKRADFLRCYGPDGAVQVRLCKAAVDPQFLLNRGNVVETE